MTKGQEIEKLNRELLDKADEIRQLCKELNINTDTLIKDLINDTAEIEAKLIESGNLEINYIEE